MRNSRFCSQTLPAVFNSTVEDLRAEFDLGAEKYNKILDKTRSPVYSPKKLNQTLNSLSQLDEATSKPSPSRRERREILWKSVPPKTREAWKVKATTTRDPFMLKLNSKALYLPKQKKHASKDNNNFTDNWSKRSAKLQNNIPAFRKNLDPIENVSVQRKVKNKALRSLLKQIKAIDDVVLDNIGGNFQDLVTCEYVRLSSFLAKSAADNLKTLLAMRMDSADVISVKTTLARINQQALDAYAAAKQYGSFVGVVELHKVIEVDMVQHLESGPSQLMQIERIPKLVEECRASLSKLAAQVQSQIPVKTSAISHALSEFHLDKANAKAGCTVTNLPMSTSAWVKPVAGSLSFLSEQAVKMHDQVIQVLGVIAKERSEIEARIQRDVEQREMVIEYMVKPAAKQLQSVLARLTDFPEQSGFKGSPVLQDVFDRANTTLHEVEAQAAIPADVTKPGAVEEMLEKLVSRAQWLTVSAQTAFDIIVGLADSTDLLLDCESVMKEHPPELRTVAAVIDQMVAVEKTMGQTHAQLFPPDGAVEGIEQADTGAIEPSEDGSKESTAMETKDGPESSEDIPIGSNDGTEASGDNELGAETDRENAAESVVDDAQPTDLDSMDPMIVTEHDKMLLQASHVVGNQARKLQQVIAVEAELVIARLDTEMKRRAQYTDNELEASQRTLQDTQQVLREGPKQLPLVPKIQMQMKSAQFAVDLAVTALAEKLDVRSDALLEQSTDALAEVLRVATDAVRQTYDIVMELKPTIERREKEDQFQRNMLRDGQAAAATKSLRELDLLLASAHPQLLKVPRMTTAMEVRGRLEKLVKALDTPVDITVQKIMMEALEDLGTRADNIVSEVEHAHAVYSAERPALESRLGVFKQRKTELEMNLIRDGTTLVKQTVCLFNYEPFVLEDATSPEDPNTEVAVMADDGVDPSTVVEPPSSEAVDGSPDVDPSKEGVTTPPELTELEKQGREQLRLVQRVVEAVNAAESALGKLEQEWAFVPQVWSDMELQKGLDRLGQLSSEFSKHARQYFDIVTVERGNLEQRQSRHQRFVADMTLELQSVREYFGTVKGNLHTLRIYGASALDVTTDEDLTAKTDSATRSLEAAERELNERQPDLTDTARLEDMLSELAQMAVDSRVQAETLNAAVSKHTGGLKDRSSALITLASSLHKSVVVPMANKVWVLKRKILALLHTMNKYKVALTAAENDDSPADVMQQTFAISMLVDMLDTVRNEVADAKAAGEFMLSSLQREQDGSPEASVEAAVAEELSKSHISRKKTIQTALQDQLSEKANRFCLHNDDQAEEARSKLEALAMQVQADFQAQCSAKSDEVIACVQRIGLDQSQRLIWRADYYVPLKVILERTSAFIAIADLDDLYSYLADKHAKERTAQSRKQHEELVAAAQAAKTENARRQADKAASDEAQKQELLATIASIQKASDERKASLQIELDSKLAAATDLRRHVDEAAMAVKAATEKRKLVDERANEDVKENATSGTDGEDDGEADGEADADAPNPEGETEGAGEAQSSLTITAEEAEAELESARQAHDDAKSAADEADADVETVRQLIAKEEQETAKNIQAKKDEAAKAVDSNVLDLVKVPEVLSAEQLFATLPSLDESRQEIRARLSGKENQEFRNLQDKANNALQKLETILRNDHTDSGSAEHTLTLMELLNMNGQFESAQSRLLTLVTNTAKSKAAALAAYDLLQNEMNVVAEEDLDLHTCILHYKNHGTFDPSEQENTTGEHTQTSNISALSASIDAQRSTEADKLKVSDSQAQVMFEKIVALEATPLDVLSKSTQNIESAASPSTTTAKSAAEDAEEYVPTHDYGDINFAGHDSETQITSTVEGLLFANELELRMLLAAATNNLTSVKRKEDKGVETTVDQSQARWNAVTDSINVVNAKLPILQSSLDAAVNKANAAKSAIDSAEAKAAEAKREEMEIKSAAIARAAVEAEAARAEYYTRLLQAIKRKSKEEMEAEALAAENSLSITLENVDYSVDNMSRTKHFLLTCLADPSDTGEHALLDPVKQTKWLSKPGMKYLRDTISRIMRLHRYRDGSDELQPSIFDGPELDRKHKLDKAAKRKYLGKIITAVIADLGVTFNIEAKVMTRGLQPEKTRAFLQLLCVAARTKGGVATAAAAATSKLTFSESVDGLTTECIQLCKAIEPLVSTSGEAVQRTAWQSMDTQQSGRVSLVDVTHWIAKLAGSRAGATFTAAAELAFKQFVDGRDQQTFLHENNFRAMCGYFAVFAAALDGFDVLLGSRSIGKVELASDANIEQTTKDPTAAEVLEAKAPSKTNVFGAEGKTEDAGTNGKEGTDETKELENATSAEYAANEIESPTSIDPKVSAVDLDPKENAASRIQAHIRGHQARELAAGRAAANRNYMSKQKWMDGLSLLEAHPLPSLSACSHDESMAATAFSKMSADGAVEVSVDEFLLWVKAQEIETESSIGSLLLLSV